MAKIAVTSEHGGAAGAIHSRRLAAGSGWAASDVVCTAGPQDRPFEEQHSRTSVAVVVAGTFQYRTSAGRELMMPGSLLLGNAGQCFTCGHEHGRGDRCISFSYSPDFSERLGQEAGVNRPQFKTPRLAPGRALAPLVARASELLDASEREPFEEFAIQIFSRAVEIERGVVRRPADAEPSSLARVTRVVRMIDQDADAPQDLTSLAEVARLSPYHFLRTFEEVTGTTPHQYVLRMRLRRAALRLRREPAAIAEIALGCGFGDISNFNRAFRAEFGLSPRAYRAVRLARRAYVSSRPI